MNKIDRTKLIHSFYQVKKSAKYIWHGLDNRNDKIKLNKNDILIKSRNGKFYNRLNKNGAVNIEISDGDLELVEQTILFDEGKYKHGI